MAKDEERRIKIIADGSKVNATIKEMEAATRELNAQLRNLPKNSAEFVAKSKELQQVKGQLTDIRNEVNGVGGVFGKLKNEIKAFSLIAIGTLGLEFLSNKVRDIIGQNTKLADSFSDIQKTTGMTKAEVENLNKALGGIDTRTSTEELRKIAVAAGQLGIPTKDILKFTDATDKLVVSLGDEFKGGAEEVTQVMGKLRNVFADVKSENVGEDMLHIGNAINQLAAAGNATGPVVADFARRIGGVGINLGLTSGQVLGLSATLEELNVNSEKGGTAITSILQKMANDTDKFAKVAGMSATKFKDLVNKDIYGAFIKVAEGSKKSGTSATEFSKILESLGVDGAGASQVFAALGANTDLLNKRVTLASTSLENTNGIMNEFALKNENAAAKAEKLGKKITAVFTSQTFNDWVVGAINGLSRFVDALIALPNWLSKNVSLLVAAGGALLVYNGNLIRTTAYTYLDIIAKKLNIAGFQTLNAAQARSTAGLVLNNIAQRTGTVLRTIGAGVIGIFTGATTASSIATGIGTAAQWAWNAAMAANPIGLVIGLVVGLTAAIMGAKEAMAEGAEAKRNAFSDKYVSKSNIELGKTKIIMKDINKLTLEQIAEKEKFINKEVAIQKALLNYALKNKEFDAEETKRLGENYKETVDLKIQLLNRKTQLLDIENKKNEEAKDKSIALSNEEKTEKEKNLKEALTEYEKLLTEFADFEDKLWSDRLSKNDQELKTSFDKYQKMIEARKALLKMPGATDEQKQKITTEINVITNTQGDKNTEIIKRQQKDLAEYIASIEARLTDEMRTEYEKRLDAIDKFYDAEIKKADGVDADIAMLEKARSKEKAKAKIDLETETNTHISALRKELEDKNKSQDELALMTINEKYAKEEELLRQKYGSVLTLQAVFLKHKSELDALKEKEIADYRIAQEKKVQEIINASKMILLNAFFDFVQAKQRQRFNDELNGIKNKEEADIAAVNRERDRLNKVADTRTAADKRADKEIARIQRLATLREHELRVKQAKAERRFALMRIALDAGIQISKVSGIAAAFVAGIATAPLAPVALAQIGFILAGAAASSAAVLAQPLPTLGKGGILKGPKHSDSSGGIPIVNSSTGIPMAMAEGEEAIIAADTTAANSEIINSLLGANGKSIAPNWFMKQPTFADTGKLLGNVKQMGEGGVVGANNSIINQSVDATEMIKAAKMFQDAVMQLTSNPLYAEVSLSDIKKKVAENRRIDRGVIPNRKSDGTTADGTKIYLDNDIL